MKRKTNLSISYLARLSMLLALVILFTVFGIGNIPVGPVVATIYHLPVIIGAVALGTKAGGVLGGAWGLLCFFLAVTGQTTDIVALGAVAANPFGYFIVAFLPRLLVGLLSGMLAQALQKLLQKQETLRFVLCGAAGALVNTVFYLGLLYLIFKPLLAATYGIELSAVIGMVMGVAMSNGVVEAAVSAIITAAVCKALAALDRRNEAI